VYDNKLYEGNAPQYDTTGDDVADYQVLRSDTQEGGLFDMLSGTGLTHFLPDELKPAELQALEDGSGTLSGLSCDDFNNKTCDEGIAGGEIHWPYGAEGNHGRKATCMRCLKCKDGYAFVDEMYAHQCDVIAGCYDNPTEYITDTLPLIYAYTSVDWETTCSDAAMVSLNPAQRLTCKLLKDNTLLDTMILYRRPDTAACYADIQALDTEGGFVELFD
jgi:hypothetical protein